MLLKERTKTMTTLKTAEEWSEHDSNEIAEILRLDERDALVLKGYLQGRYPQIQLNAYKAGMIEAAGIINNQKDRTYTKLEINNLEELRQRILLAAEKKGGV